MAGDVFLGKFEYISSISENGGISINLCKDPTTGEKLVCKTVSSANPSEESVATLKREHELLSKVQGPDILELHSLEKSAEGYPIVAFKHFQGQRLAQGESRLSMKECISLFIRIVKALSSIHDKKIIHRDLNPDNILWNPQTKEFRIIDFNLATDIFSESVKADSIEELYGTLPFISPEQTGRMNRKVDFRSDYYSLGMTFYHFLYGRSPFNASDAIGWVYCHITEKPPLLSDKNSDIPQELALIIDKLLAKNAEDRYQSSYGLIKDLEIVAENLSKNNPQNFKPGAHDVQQWLQIPEKLYGREAELKEFLNLFEKVKNNQSIVCTITGPSGMGKSVLVNEVNKPVTAARGNFIVGKCDQYKRNIPYSAIKDAFADLIRLHLAKSSLELEELRHRILGLIGENAKVISEIIPELETITGPLKAVPHLPANDARKRFQRAFQQFIQVFTANDQPLVVFLDDLQWSDLPSLKLLEFLMTEAALRSLMIVAVFRDNEVKPGHPLLESLGEISKIHEITNIKLNSLSTTSISQLLADTLHCEPAQTLSLAEIIQNKTSGNPFHIVEMIKTLHDSDAIRFNSQQGKWHWDMEKIALAGISSDVVELMVLTLQKCPPSAVERLKIAACLGAQFELNNLALASGVQAREVVENLWPTIEKGLVIPLGESYKLLKAGMSTQGRQFFFKFQHDRVHEAAYQLIDEKDRINTHLNIGRILRKSQVGPALENHVIEIVRHYNISARLITDPAERLECCQLNYIAAIKARNSVAFEAYLHYISLAKDYLPGNPWSEHYALARKIYMGLSDAAYMLANNKLVEDTNRELLAHVTDKLDRAEVEIMRGEQYFNLGRPNDALQVSLEAIRSLGLSFPKKTGKLDVLKKVISTSKLLKKVKLDEIIKQPKLEDRRMQLIFKLFLTVTNVSATSGDRNSSAFSVLYMTQLTIQHGICTESAYGFIGAASVYGNFLNKLELGHKLAKVALEIDERYGTVALKPAIRYLYGFLIAPHNINLDKISDIVAQAIEAGQIAGDQFMLPVAAAMGLASMPELNLEEAIEKAEKYYLPICASANNEKCHDLGLALQRHRKAMTSGLDEIQLSAKNEADQKALQFFHETKFHSAVFTLHLYNAIEKFIGCQYKNAYQDITKAAQSFTAGRGYIQENEFHFFNVLITSRALPFFPHREQKAMLKTFKGSFKRMAVLSEHQPYNYKHQYLAMRAEYHRLNKEFSKAADCYEKALRSVERTFLRDTALLNELVARFHQETGKERHAQLFIKDAMAAYKNWRAHGKMRQLAEEWPHLRQEHLQAAVNAGGSIRPSTIRSKDQSLDVATITRAAQTLSSQVQMEGLFKQLMKIVSENAGSHYTVLMTRDQNDSKIKVVATALNSETTLLQNQNLSEFPEISLPLMLYATRINQTVIIDDLEKDDRFQKDQYLIRVKPKSILAMPITIHSQTVGYFYLENRMTAGSFTANRVEVLNILGTQAAISLENALLYASLEQKVKERTEQLAERSRDIRTILNNIKQGILTIKPDLMVHSEYSRFLEAILQTDNIAERSVLELLFAESNISADKLDQIKSTLEFSLQQDMLGFTINEGLLIRELIRNRPDHTQQHLEIDWEPIVSPTNLVEKIIVTIRDVTEIRTIREANRKNQRELNILNQLLAVSSERFRMFGDNASDLLEKTRNLLQNSQQTSDSVAIAYRHLHTIKGNARVLGFSELTSIVHEAESLLDKARQSESNFQEIRVQIQQALQEVGDHLAEYQSIYRNRLLSYNADRERDTDSKLKKTLEAKLKSWQDRYPDLHQELESILFQAQTKALEDIIEPLRLDSNILAESLDKAPPRLHMEGAGIRLDKAEVSLLTNTFGHLFSNALNHGIEARDVRLKAGKEPEGQIFIKAIEHEKELEFFISDDGQGLNLPKIKSKAISSGLLKEGAVISDQDIADFIFASGVSTAEQLSQSAGRGVGMDAIRSMIEDAGGHLELILDPSSAAAAKTFQIHFTLPRAKGRLDLVA
jgi:predicted ATPase/GAF domain-containing protein/HPt (histidine-containing phosphotransfer) domain-containing protein